MNVSHSRLSLFKSCRKKYWFKYVRKIEPKFDAIEATVGQVVHRAFDMLYKGEPQQDILDFIDCTFVEAAAKAEPSKQEDYIIARFTALGMYISNPWINEKHLIVQSEQEFCVRISNLRRDRLIGRIDRKSRLKSSVKVADVFVLRELKTTGLTQRQFSQRIRKAVQPTTYMYADRKISEDEVECCVYDVIMRHKLRKRNNENAEQFGKRILADYADPNKKDFYYQQHRIYRNDIDFKLFEKDLVKQVYDMRDALKCNRFYRNQDECYNYNRECPYYKICHTDVIDPLMIQLFYNEGGN